MKQPKLLSPDAFSDLELCAKMRRGSAPYPTAEAYILWAVLCQVVIAGALALCLAELFSFLVNKSIAAYF